MEEQIKIKLGKDNKIFMSLMIIIFGIMIVVMAELIQEVIVQGKKDNYWAVILLGICIVGVFVLAVWLWIASMRTLTLSKRGCQVSVFRHSRMYPWEELKTKRMVTYQYMNCKLPYKTCIELYKKKIKKIKVIYDSFYYVFHPFAYVYIFFGEKEKLDVWEKNAADARMPFLYVTDESNIIEKLHQWGVELEAVTIEVIDKKYKR